MAISTNASFAIKQNKLLSVIFGSRLYLMLVGFLAFLAFWHFAVDVWRLPRFSQMPGLFSVLKEWLNPDPVYGLSIYTAEYYTHIFASCVRVFVAFALATILGVPLGLFMGWSTKVREYVFPVALVDQTFRENGLTEPGEMHNASPAKIAEIFGADAILYIKVNEYGATYRVISSEVIVSASAELIDARTGRSLWTGSAKASNSENKDTIIIADEHLI